MASICEAKGSLKKLHKTKSGVILELDLGSITLKLSTRPMGVSERHLRHLIGKEITIAYSLGTDDQSPTLLGVRHVEQPVKRLSFSTR